MANYLNPTQIQATTLAGSGATAGDTTIVLSSFKDINGVQLTMANFGQIGYGVLEPNNNTQEEQISFTGLTANTNGTTTLSGVKTVLFKSPYTETSGLSKSHPGGTKFIITNSAAYYNKFAIKANTESITGIWTFATGATPIIIDQPSSDTQVANKYYVDHTAVSGAANASTTVKGIVEEATAAEITAATQAGGTGAELFVNPAYLYNSIYYTQLPTANEKAAIAGNSGTAVSASNKLIDAADVSAAAASGKIVRATGTALPALSAINLTNVPSAANTTSSYTAGENISAGQIVSRFIKTVINTAGGNGTNINFGRTTESNGYVKSADVFQFASAVDVLYVEAQLMKGGSPTDNIIMSIQTDSAGSPSGSVVGSSVTFAGSGLTGGMVKYLIKFPPTTQLSAATNYWLVFERSGSTSDTNYYAVGGNATDNTAKDYTGSVWQDIGGGFNRTIEVIVNGFTTAGTVGKYYQKDFILKEHILGIATAAATTGNSVTVATYGITSGLSGFTANDILYPPTTSGTAGTLSVTPTATEVCNVVTSAGVITANTAWDPRYLYPIYLACSATTLKNI
jgi:hypothetical protein